MAERKKIPYRERKFDKAHKQAHDNQYIRDNFDRIEIVVPKGYREELKAIATSKGMSLSELIKAAIDEYIK